MDGAGGGGQCPPPRSLVCTELSSEVTLHADRYADDRDGLGTTSAPAPILGLAPSTPGRRWVVYSFQRDTPGGGHVTPSSFQICPLRVTT